MSLPPIDRAAKDGPTHAQGVLKLCDSRTEHHSPGRVARRYGLDQSDTVEYRFNSAGYRCEEFWPQAKFRICIIGESNAVGTGIPLVKTFGFQLKVMLARLLGMTAPEINLINLSIGGASADYCARTVFRQMPGIPADLVICLIPRQDRVEYRAGQVFKSLVVTGLSEADLDRLPPPLLGFCEYYDDDVGHLNAVKNTLLINNYLASKGFDYIIATEEMPEPGQGHAMLDPYLEELDPMRILRHSFFRQKADLAADHKHAGPRCHAAFALHLLHHYGHMMRGRGNIGLADRIQAEALRLIAESEDYRVLAGLAPRPVSALRDDREKQG